MLYIAPVGMTMGLNVISSEAEKSGSCVTLIIPAVTEIVPVRILLSNQPEFFFHGAIA